jgi:hypothetical protein
VRTGEEIGRVWLDEAGKAHFSLRALPVFAASIVRMGRDRAGAALVREGWSNGYLELVISA